MRLAVNVSKADRKNLAKELGQKLGYEVKYAGVPTCAYIIGEATLDREVYLEFPDGETAYVEALQELGYECIPEAPKGETGMEETENITETEEPEAEAEGDALTVEMPRSFFTEEQLDNLEKMIGSRASLIKKAVGTDSLDIEIDDEKVAFPWFTSADAAEAKAYTEFVSKLCHTAKDAKRVTAKDREVESEKFAFRCFLLKLGFIGSEFKEERKILLKNLTGPAAFPNEAAQKAHIAKQKAMKEVRS